MNQGSLSEPERSPPLIRDALRELTDVLSELLKLQKFGHLFIEILCVCFFTPFLYNSCNF